MMRRNLTWLGALLLVLTLAACQTTEAPTVVGETPMPDSEVGLDTGSRELALVEASSFVATPPAVPWNEEGVLVEILGVGLGNKNGADLDAGNRKTITVPDIEEVRSVFLQVPLKFSNSNGSAVSFYVDGSPLATVNRDDAVRNASGWFYEAEYVVPEGAVGDVEFTIEVNDEALFAEGSPPFSTPRAFVAYVVRKADDDVRSIGARTYPDVWYLRADLGYVPDFEYTLEFEPEDTDRTVDVQYALAELENDTRPVTVAISVGGTTPYDKTYTSSFSVPGGMNEFYISGGAFTLPANETSITLRVTSPAPGGDSVWPLAITATVVETPPPPPPPDGCTLTRGYWQTHSKYGPAPYDPTWALIPEDGEDTMFFKSGQTYYQVMWTAPRGGNAYYILAPQWIAAYLNVLNGAAIPADVLQAWLDAQELFETYTPAEVGARRFAERDTFVSLAGILDDYNNGLLGVPHCDTLE